MKIIFVLVVALAVITMADDFNLLLLHMNDMHSRFDETDIHCNECREDDAAKGICYGGFARVAEMVREEKQKAKERGVPSLFMVAGDTFQGTPFYTFYKWHPVVDFINQLDPDIMTLGNHEFDDGVPNLVSYLNGIKHIPTIVANLNMTAEPELEKLVSKSHVFTINNTKVGVVGYLTTDTPYISTTGNVKFFDEIESLKKETKKLRDNGVNIIIGLGHSGIEVDQKIAMEVEDIDLIVGGHSHTFLYTGTPPSIETPYGPYPFIVTNAKKKEIPILQVYAYTKYFGKVDLQFDSNGNLKNITGIPKLLNNDIQQDPSMLKVLNVWKPQLIEKTNITIGRTAVELMNHCYNQECNLGNIITDSYVYYNILMNKKYDNYYWTDAPIALLQAGGIRATINETSHDGYITYGQLINVRPFSNLLVKITISGKTLLEVFEQTVKGNDHSGLLQVSGVQVKFDLTKSPGNRVTSLLLRCGKCSIPKYEPINLASNYTIIVDDYLANGGDKYKLFKNIVKKNEIIDVTDANATATYMQSISPIFIGIENRISFIEHSNSTTSIGYKWNSQLLLISLFVLLFFIYQDLM